MDVSAIPEPEGWDDPLSGLEGPAFWERVLVAEVARADKYGHALTVVVAELEGIGSLSDAWGDEIALHSLHEAAECLRRVSRTSDYCTRIAAERFGIVLTETDEIEAINFVERVREAVPRAMPRDGHDVRFSFGWANHRHGESAASLVMRAQRRLVRELLA